MNVFNYANIRLILYSNRLRSTSLSIGLVSREMCGQIVSRKLILNMQHKHREIVRSDSHFTTSYSCILKQDKDVHGRHANKYLIDSRSFFFYFQFIHCSLGDNKIEVAAQVQMGNLELKKFFFFFK